MALLSKRSWFWFLFTAQWRWRWQCCSGLVGTPEVESHWSRIHYKTSAGRVLKHCWLCYSSFLCDSTEDLDSGCMVDEASQGALLSYLHIHSSALLLYISVGSGLIRHPGSKDTKILLGRSTARCSSLYLHFTSLNGCCCRVEHPGTVVLQDGGLVSLLTDMSCRSEDIYGLCVSKGKSEVNFMP